MKRIVILGSSAASVKIIESIRAKDASSEITIFAFDGHYPYRRDMFASFIAQEIILVNVYCRDQKFYEDQSVNVITDKKIARINIKRKVIFTEDKEQIEYDILIIGDTPENRFPSVKGTNKAGVFGYKKLKDIDQIVNDLFLRDTIAIQSDSFSGLCTAAAFTKRKKEVLLISSPDDFLGQHFEGDVLDWIIPQFDQVGLRVVRENCISEILGDKDVKAIRLKSGKVLSTQVLIFVETDDDLRLFAGSELQADKKLQVNSQFRTNVESIFAVDQVSLQDKADPVVPLEVLEVQGRVVAAAIAGEACDEKESVLTSELKLEGLTITVIGQTKATENRTVHRVFDQGHGRYEGLYLEGGCLVGAVLVNSTDKKEEFARLIRSKEHFEATNEAYVVDQRSQDGHSGANITNQDISTELIDN